MNISKIVDKELPEIQKCFSTYSSGQSLKDFVNESIKGGIHINLIDRLQVSHELMNSFHDLIREASRKNIKNGFKTIMFLTYDNVYVQKGAHLRIEIDYQGILNELEKEDIAYQAYANINHQSIYQNNVSSNYDINHFVRDYEQHAMMKSIMILLFYIIFGTHPYHGRAYYGYPYTIEKLDENIHFNKDHHFIFNNDLDENFNRFIAGYQEKEWLLWKKLTLKQQEFFINGFNNENLDIESIFKEWKQAFIFDEINVIGDQKDDLKLALFNDTEGLILGKNMAMPLYDRTNLKTNHILLVINQVDMNLNKKVLLFEGAKVSGFNLGINEDPIPFIEIISSKKANLLGAKILSGEIVAFDEKTVKTYKSSEVIPLIPSITIDIQGYKVKVIPNLNLDNKKEV